MTLEGANGGDRERRKPVLSATPPHSTTGPKQPFEKDWPSLDQGLPLREHHQGRKDCGPSWRHTGGAQARLCGSWWLPTAPQALVPGSVPHPTQGHRMKHPLQPPSQEFMWTPSQDARACILDSVWEGSSPCPQVKFFFVRGPLDGNPLLQLNCITMLLFIQHPQK